MKKTKARTVQGALSGPFSKKMIEAYVSRIAKAKCVTKALGGELLEAFKSYKDPTDAVRLWVGVLTGTGGHNIREAVLDWHMGNPELRGIVLAAFKKWYAKPGIVKKVKAAKYNHARMLGLVD